MRPAELDSPFRQAVVPDPPFIAERVADLPPAAATQALIRESKAMPKGNATQRPILEQIEWQATTNRPIPQALKQGLAKARSAAIDDD